MSIKLHDSLATFIIILTIIRMKYKSIHRAIYNSVMTLLLYMFLKLHTAQFWSVFLVKSKWKKKV